MKTTFRISDKTRENVLAVIEAETHEAAATKFVRKHRNAPAFVAHRVTGDIGKSGMFQGYKPLGSGLNSVGDNFHVTEI